MKREKAKSANHWLKWVLLLPLLAVFVLLAFQFTSGEPLFDFTAFWIAGKLTVTGGDPYATSDWLPLYEPYHLGLADNQTFLYPKPILPLFIPFGLLDLHTASVLWLVLTQIAVFGAVWLLTRRWQQPSTLPVLLFFLSIVVSRSYLVTLTLGQLSGIFLLLLAVALFLWRQEKWFWGGMLFSLLILKPQMGLPIVGLMSLWFLTRRQWIYFYGLAAGGALMLATGWLLDPTWIGKFLQIGTGKVATTFGFHPTLWGLNGYLCGHAADCTLLWGGATSALLLGAFLWLIFQRKLPMRVGQAFSLAILSGLLLTPYLWVYDQLLLLIPLAITVETMLENSPLFTPPALVPLVVSLVSLAMLRVAENMQNDVFSVLVPLVCLLFFGAAFFGKPTSNAIKE